VYLQTGQTGPAGTAVFTFGAGSATRTFKIKVTYLECTNLNL
jgi:hypothetical protein